MSPGLTAKAARLASGGALLVALLSQPALAAPANVGGMAFDAKQQRISIGISGTVSVRTQRVKNPDRLVIDLSEARVPLGQPVPIVQVQSSRIRSIRIGQNSFVPPVVRLVVDLMPGFEPMVKINQSSGKLLITLANPTPPQGERDLESLPGFPSPGAEPTPPQPSVPDAPLPQVITRLPAPAHPASRPPSPPSPVAPAPRPTPTPSAPAWTPPPIPGWAPRPTPMRGEPASGPPVSGPPVSGPPVSGPSGSGPSAAGPTGAASPAPALPVSGNPAPGGAPVVIIPDDVRPATPQPTPDPFNPWTTQPVQPPADPQLPAGSSDSPAEGAPKATDAPEPAAAESVLPADRQPAGGFGSSFQLRWQQIETLEEYGGPAPSFAYPAGINGFDLEHWFMPYLGAGLDARILFYDLTVESIRQHRSDAALGSYVALRYPLGIFEPSLRAGYMGRTVTVESESTGTTFPFSPLQTYYGPTLSGKLRVALLPGFGLDLHGKFLPGTQGALYPGFPAIHPLSGQGWGASLVTDLMQGYVSLGYATEQLASGDGAFKQTFSGITLGAGFRY